MRTAIELPINGGQSLKYTRESVLYAEGDEADCWYTVSSGVVRTCRYLSSGQRQITGFFFPRDVFGIEKDVYRTTAEAVTDAVITRHGNRLLKLADAQDLALKLDAGEILNHALERAEERIELLGLRGASVRVARFLLTLAVHRSADGHVHLPMQRTDIADYLAIDAATVSRTLSLFVRRGLLSFHGPQLYRINDFERLEALVDGEPTPRFCATGWEDSQTSPHVGRGSSWERQEGPRLGPG